MKTAFSHDLNKLKSIVSAWATDKGFEQPTVAPDPTPWLDEDVDRDGKKRVHIIPKIETGVEVVGGSDFGKEVEVYRHFQVLFFWNVSGDITVESWCDFRDEIDGLLPIIIKKTRREVEWVSESLDFADNLGNVGSGNLQLSAVLKIASRVVTLI
jgi:hypothetical protein